MFWLGLDVVDWLVVVVGCVRLCFVYAWFVMCYYVMLIVCLFGWC